MKQMSTFLNKILRLYRIYIAETGVTVLTDILKLTPVHGIKTLTKNYGDEI